ncbi:MAG: hypothetical protein J6Q53_04955 [Oscillospiraceae bacterium]|nr:hypothetical protein [Oscillospiraceae bacterium]
MENRTSKCIHIILVLLLSFMLLTGCGYTEGDIEEARNQAYNEGYDDGFDDGYYRGINEQQEEDYEDLLIDGRSIRDLEMQVYGEYGLTPSEAFTIVDEYEYDSTHGGYTKSEYENAVEAIFYTAAIFPYDY